MMSKHDQTKIPVIDFGPVFAGKPGALESVAPALSLACQTVGFFYAFNHGVSEPVIKRGFQASRRFFALSMERKLKLKLNQDKIGYLAFHSLRKDDAGKPSFNESFFVSHDRGEDHPDIIASTPLVCSNQWPKGMPGTRRDMMAYFHALAAMCNRMLPAFAVALDMTADFFDPYFTNEPHAKARFIHYPPAPADSADLFGQPAHTDFSFMAALARTDVPGLAVKLPSGEWFPPKVIPGTLLINVGFTLQRWSNDRFKAVLHRVQNESGKDRYSMAYFHSPNLKHVIDCLPSCVSAENPARYQPALHSDLWLELYGRK